MEEAEKKREAVNTELAYQERLQFIMNRDSNQLCAIYLDVTEDTMLAISTEEYHLKEKDIKGIVVQEWLESYIYPNMVYEEERTEFQEKFNRDALLNRFQNGETYLKFRHCYWHHGLMLLYRIHVTMFQNPNNKHLEAYVVWRDDTERYIDKQIGKTLSLRDYKAIALIDIKTEILYFRIYRFAEMAVDVNKELSYQDIMKQMTVQRIATYSRERFTRCTDLKFLVDNLNLTEQYSFQAENIGKQVERYSYYWFDKEKQILLLVVDDMTKELETDSVTGALNKVGFFQKTERIIAQNPERRFAILYFNLQRFKAINDLFGYEIGDAVLHNSANALESSFLKPVALGRMEADRFVLLADVKHVNLDKLPELLHGSYVRDDTKIDIFGRCGIYYIPKYSKLLVSDMCDRAKLAKQYITNRYVRPYAVFNEEMQKDYEQRSIAMIELDDAIEKREIEVYYQPIYDAWTEKIVFAEALARWNSNKSGMILPDKFIPVLEESGHITKLDRFVQQSVKQLQEERYTAGLPMVNITVNLSRMDLMDGNLLQSILEDIEHSEIPKDSIYYEVTESAYAVITEQGVEFLEKLQQNGVKTLVDDFGSGVSSFSTIRDYSFDIIKLDMGFVRKVGKNKKNNNILISLIELAHRLGMKVVAEGVETKEQMEFLKNYGCDYLQGFYFSRPVPRAEFERMLEEK